MAKKSCLDLELDVKPVSNCIIQRCPRSLDAILYTKLDELTIAREAMDKAIIAFTSELTEQDIRSSLSYTNTKGKRYVQNCGFLLQHFFNHQTHHRGQVSTLLNQAGIDIGVTDLVVQIPSE